MSLAACTNQPEIVSYLMGNPHRQADVTDQDSRGNTVLHTLVVIADDTTDNTDMIARIYDQILVQHFKSEAKTVQLEAVENNQGLTPLKLAAKLGKIGVGLISPTRFPFHANLSAQGAAQPRPHRLTNQPFLCVSGQLFRHILHREFTDERMRPLCRKFTEWVYGPVRSSLYDTSSIDTDQRSSVLEVVIFGKDVPVGSRPKGTKHQHPKNALESCWEPSRGLCPSEPA